MSEWFRSHPEASFPDAALAGYGFDREPKAVLGKQLCTARRTTMYATTEAGSRGVTPRPARSKDLGWLRPELGTHKFPLAKWYSSLAAARCRLRAILNPAPPAYS